MPQNLDEQIRGIGLDYRRHTNRDYRPAVLADGGGVIAVPNRPGYVYIREQTSNGLSAARQVLLPSTVSIVLKAGTPVKLGFDEQGREIILGGDTSAMLASGVSTVTQLQNFQSARVNQDSIETLSVIPTSPPSLYVYIKSWSVITSGTYNEFPGVLAGTLTLPPVGSMNYAMLLVQNDYLTPEIHYSTARSISDIPLGKSDIQEALNAAMATSTPVRVIPLNGSMSSVTLTDIQNGRDLRQMVNTR